MRTYEGTMNRAARSAGIALAMGMGMGSMALAGCAADTEAPSDVQALSQGNGSLHPLGLLHDQAEADLISAREVLNAPPAGGVPAAVDLSGSFASPGNQGNLGSCVGWAVAYAAKTYHEVQEEGWSHTTDNHRFSPSWVYNQINFGWDSGSYISDALNLVVDDGCDTLSAFPYVNGDWSTQPDADSMSRAERFPASNWYTIAASESAIKNELAAGRPIIIGISVLPDFDSLNGTTNRFYDDDSGSSRGGHAVTIIGYDDNEDAFQFVNSWGTAWGDGGYGWIAYDFVDNAKLNMRPYVLIDDDNLPLLGDTNDDGCVDNDDYDALVLSYNYSVSSGQADPSCDFNGDDWVDMLDYITLTEHWLEGCNY